MAVNYCFHAFGETIVDFGVVSVEDLVSSRGNVFKENNYQVDLKIISQFL